MGHSLNIYDMGMFLANYTDNRGNKARNLETLSHCHQLCMINFWRSYKTPLMPSPLRLGQIYSIFFCPQKAVCTE